MRLLPAVFCLLFALPALADLAPATLARAAAADEIVLADGRILHLAGITPPPTEPWRSQAQNFLQELISGRSIVFDDAVPDRYGRLSTQVYGIDSNGQKIWLQGEMLKRGLAFVYPPTGFETQLDEMLTLEAAARAARTGIWADAFYADTPADRADIKEGQFAFVSGVVFDAVRVKNMVYLNFGPDWKSDFTIAIAAHDLRNFRRAKIDPLILKGKTVRVRGWVKRNYGPMIAVTVPEQIEILKN